MIEYLTKKFTNNFKQVPLFYVIFDLEKFKKSGEKGSCDINIHPSLKDDKYVEEKTKELVDYIRNNYNMEELSK